MTDESFRQLVRTGMGHAIGFLIVGILGGTAVLVLQMVGRCMQPLVRWFLTPP